MTTIQLNIEGMHCGACVRRVKAALAAVPAVTAGGASVRDVAIGRAELEVAADAAEGRVRAEAAKALVDAGFTVGPT